MPLVSTAIGSPCPGVATVAAELVAVALGVGIGGMEALVDAVEFF